MDSQIATISRRAAALQGQLTAQQFIVAHNPDALQRRFTELTLVQASAHDVACLCELREAYGQDAVLLYVQTWLVKLNEYLNKSQAMTNGQVQETAQLFYQKAKRLNLAELTLFFNSVKTGDYGELVGYLDGLKVLSYLRQFLVKRADARAKHRRDSERKNTRQLDQAAVSLSQLSGKLPNIEALLGAKRMPDKTPNELQRENEKKVAKLKKREAL